VPYNPSTGNIKCSYGFVWKYSFGVLSFSVLLMYAALLLMTAGSRAIMLFLMAVVLPNCTGQIYGSVFSRIPFRKIPRNRSEVNPAISRNLSFKRKTTTGKKHVYPNEELFPCIYFPKF
jgi:hypothetical protein